MPDNDLEYRLQQLEQQAIANTKLLREARQNQRRSEIFQFGMLGLLSAIVLGLSYENGVFSYKLSGDAAMAVIGAIAGLPAAYKYAQSRGDEKLDEKVLSEPLQPPYS